MTEKVKVWTRSARKNETGFKNEIIGSELPMSIFYSTPNNWITKHKRCSIKTRMAILKLNHQLYSNSKSLMLVNSYYM